MLWKKDVMEKKLVFVVSRVLNIATPGSAIGMVTKDVRRNT